MKDERGSHAKRVGPAHSTDDTSASKPTVTRRAVIVMLACVAVLICCGYAVKMYRDAPQTRSEPQQEGPQMTPEEYAKMDAKRRREAREIVCWGDSMTSGHGASEAYIDTPEDKYDASYQGYPEILAHFTHLHVYNFGVVGARSDEIVAMQASPEPPEQGRFEHFDRNIAEYAQEHTGDVLILEIGSNGGWNNDYDTLIAQYQQMISYAGVGDQYLILGDTDDPGSSVADTEQGEIGQDCRHRDTQWEIALDKEFGQHFINMRRNILGFGLKYCGLEETDEDRELMKYGYISKQLRSDWTHFNSYGYYAKARVVYLRGRKLGLWD